MVSAKTKRTAEKKQTNSSISSFLDFFRYPVKVCLLVRLRMFLDENLPTSFLFCDFRGQTERCRTCLITWMWWIIVWNERILEQVECWDVSFNSQIETSITQNDERVALTSGDGFNSIDMWVCLNIVYPYTQWLMIIIPMKNGYFIGGIPYFQTNPCGYLSSTYGTGSLIIFHSWV